MIYELHTEKVRLDWHRNKQKFCKRILFTHNIMNVLELFSGIGGMHLALNASGVSFVVRASIDINPVANSIYTHNFPQTELLPRNIQAITAAFIADLRINAILMSPPCQPFTRNGRQADMADERNHAFIHIIKLLPQCPTIDRILIENVKGFETSQMREILAETLRKCGFRFQEFILSPGQLGVPNTRHRYYCIAKKKPLKFGFELGELATRIPGRDFPEPGPISGVIDEDLADFGNYMLPDKVLSKYINLLDIAYPNSVNCCCFTKAYSRFVEGTGSVYTNNSRQFVQDVLAKLKKFDRNSADYLNEAKKLNLRYFTPAEICKLMCFPASFQFPPSITKRQCYMVLGNSVNIKVVAELIKLLE